MDSFVEDLRQPLVQRNSATDGEEELQCFSQSFSLDEGSSSGYESTDIDTSGNESDWSMKADLSGASVNSIRQQKAWDSNLKKAAPSHNRPPTTSSTTGGSKGSMSAWVTSTATLCSNLKLIIDMPELCDVTFLVGEHEVPVHGVRAILGTRSKVFYQLIMKHLNLTRTKPKKSSRRHSKVSRQQPADERLVIPVKKYGPEVFRMLIQFIHCGTAQLTDDSVAGLLCGAEQFELKDLRRACWQYIGTRLNQGHGDHILEAARQCSHHRHAQDIVDEICSAMEKLSVVRPTSEACSNS